MYQVLLEAKADFSIANKEGETPLMSAESNGKDEVVALIKAHGLSAFTAGVTV